MGAALPQLIIGRNGGGMDTSPATEPSTAESASIRSGAAALLGRLADVVLPPLCLACRAPVHAHGGLCASCWSRIDFIKTPLCDRLGIPLPYAAGDKVVSVAALANPPVYDRARAVAAYGDVMRDLVHNLKYRDRHEGLRLFGRWMARAGDELLREADVLVPVPLDRFRLWWRRFNQSLLLAERVGAASGRPCKPFLLARTRRTPSQVGLTVEQRRRNVAGAFAVPAQSIEAVRGRAVLLVDDVLTTGATANACARALKRAHASRVDVLTLARAVDPVMPRP